MYFLSLWARNMKGIIEKSFSESIYALFIPVHICTAFLSVPVAGLVKTIYDYGTRTYTDDKEIQPVITSIENMNDEQMGKLIHHLKNPSVEYKSNSSARIITHISTDADKNNEKEAIENLKNKWLDESSSTRIQYIINEDPDADIFSHLKIVDTTNFSQKQKNELHNTRKRQLDNGLPIFTSINNGSFANVAKCTPPRPVKAGFDLSKENLLSYMNDELNNGKKLFQRVIGFFSQQHQNSVVESIQPSKTIRMENI